MSKKYNLVEDLLQTVNEAVIDPTPQVYPGPSNDATQNMMDVMYDDDKYPSVRPASIQKIYAFDDKDVSLTISALEKLISGNFWKQFNLESIETVKHILESYIDSTDENTFEMTSKLIRDDNIDILPKIPDEKW